jgi:hypothetical protein
MGEFIRDRLPDPLRHFVDAEGLQLTGSGKWRTSRCEFHDGSDSMRINPSPALGSAWLAA